MAITFITPHQRPNSGGVYAIEQLARYGATLTEVNVVVAKGEPRPIDGVTMHGGEVLASRKLPAADALVIPSDLRDAQPLFELLPECGVPMLLFQGYGIPGDAVVRGNLELAAHCICVSTWLVQEAAAAGCTTTLLRHGLDREVFFPGPSPRSRGRVVSFMTHPRDWKGTEDGLAALRIARATVKDLKVHLFGKAEVQFEDASFLPSPNQLTEVAALYRDSAVFVCASWEEGFGLPGVEAIASGSALATTDTKGSRDYAEHMRTALVTRPHDPAALAGSIVELLRKPALRQKLVAAGQTQIDAMYPSWEHTAKLFVADVHAAAAALRPTVRPAAPAKARRPESELDELEADLAHSRKQAKRARRRARELERELIDEREAREELDVAREAAARALAVRVREAELQGEREAAAQQEFEAELGRVRETLASELDETRAELNRLQRAEAQHRGELARLTSELELAGTQRRRLQAALARARADALVAEAERSAFERQVSELALALERGSAPGENPERAGDDLHLPGNGGGTRSAALAELRRLPSAARAWEPLPAAELAVQDRFKARYRELAVGLPAADGDADPLALPTPADLHGMLASSANGQDAGSPTVDVVVCVHDALDEVRRCLWALMHKASRRFRLIIVNDGSDEPTTAFLSRLASDLPAITLIHRPDPPHGYTIAANLGLAASTGDYVVLLNSDTIVTYYWLERIVACGERDAQIGILGPLSNAATHQSVPERRSEGRWADNPLPQWLTEDGMALLLEHVASGTGTRLPFINGFCYVIRRAVIDKIGTFDEESFPDGYAEENDYSQRAREAGFTLAVADDAYVYHARSRSYGIEVRDKVARAGYETFRRKHGEAKIDALVAEIESDTSLEPVRAAINGASSSPSATASALLDESERRLSIAFVLPGLSHGGSGGSHSIYQEVRGLRALGLPAQIVLAESVWDRARATYADADELFTTYGSTDQLAEHTAGADVIVATHFKSVAQLAALREHRDDFLPAYYVQDYEAMFDFGDSADNREAAGSYTAIPNMLLFAKTHWLCNVVSRRHGVFVAKVAPSIDTDVFHSEGRPAHDGPLRVAAMVRPRTPRRQPHSTTSVLERLADQLGPAVETRTFGCTDGDLKSLTRSAALHDAHLGLLKRDQVADLLRNCDVFLDMSTYQAFGRTALEAMACGSTALLPRLGGVWEFAEQDANAIAIDTFDRERAYAAVAALARDPDRVAALQARAVQTAAGYSSLRAALSEYVVMLHAFRARFG